MNLQDKKILLLSTEDSVGGAYELMYRMATALYKVSCDTSLVVLRRRHTDLFVKTIYYSAPKYTFVQRLIRRVKKLLGLHLPELAATAKGEHVFSYQEEERQQFVSAEQVLRAINFTPDIIFVGLTTGFLNTTEIVRLYRLTNAKIVYVMLDMWPLTGGCHAIRDCQGYMNACANCPATIDTCHATTPHAQYLLRQEAYREMRPYILGGSSLIKRVWAQSPLRDYTTLLPIPSCIPTNIFNDRCRAFAKQIWDIPKNKFVIFAGSDNAKDPRKGRKYLVEALCHLYNDDRIKKEDIMVILAGNHNHADEDTRRIPFETKYIDYIRDMRLLALLYQAADVYVMSSLEEGGPMMVPEAMLCGTMVVGFETGFLESDDFIQSGINGWRVPLRNSQAMANALFDCMTLSQTQHNDVVDSARDNAMARMSDNAFITQVFNNLL